MSEVALRRSERRLPDLAEPGTGMAELGRDLVIRRVNEAFADLFGTTPDDAIGTAFCGWFLPALESTVRGALAVADRFDERLVGLGPSPFLADVTGRLIDDDGDACLVVLVRPVPPVAATTPVRLAALDAQILEGLAAGEPAIHLAMRLYLSRQAVDYRIGAMLRKLGAPNRAALVSMAYAAGVLRPEQWPPRVVPHARED
ncbi:LuxR C-terminal-related transcriptional regulator [Amycolatopsis sp. lyj-346]|uniref:LuxR C-terminal-related transcriptional regulator n=1 Tax=Amycolatopsis sp. lyj-346 TaxID=2789289 RepID=UPI003977FDFE